MNIHLSLVIGWGWIVGCSLVPLRAVHWTEWYGNYLSPSAEQPESKHLYDWQVAKAELKFPDLNEGNMSPEAFRITSLLPTTALDRLKQLGIIAHNGNEWRLCQKLSLTFVLHQPLREESFAASERLWYRKDVASGEAAVLLIPLSHGQIS